jgi:hypothetical protein
MSTLGPKRKRSPQQPRRRPRPDPETARGNYRTVVEHPQRPADDPAAEDERRVATAAALWG